VLSEILATIGYEITVNERPDLPNVRERWVKSASRINDTDPDAASPSQIAAADTNCAVPPPQSVLCRG
jgi:hypothetical protein